MTSADRHAMVDRIQQALAANQLAFEELDHRFELVYAATTGAELEQAAAGLPDPPPPPPPIAARHLAPATTFSFIGDTKLGGWIAVGPELSVTSLIGDTVVDLSSADIPGEGVTITVRSLVGDAKIVVPDGVRVQIDRVCLIGDHRERLVPPVAGAPTVHVRLFSAIGDVQVYSLSQVPDGPLRRLWAALRRP